MADMGASGCREKGEGRKRRSPFQMTEVIGLDPTPRPCSALRHPRPPTHSPLTPSVKKLRSIRKLGTRFGRRLGSKDQE